MRRVTCILFVLIFSWQVGFSQRTSTFNNLPLKVSETGSYRFVISGHFYGDGTNKTGYPANTLLANLDWINGADFSMMVALGDMFLDVKNEIPKYKQSFFAKLHIPLFNAVGNHDLTGSVYQENFGETFFWFELNSDIHVILDSEMDNGDIKGDQLKMFEAINTVCSQKPVNNVFVYAHRTLWKETYPELEPLFKDNTQSIITTNFETDVLPVVSEISKKTNLFWFAGSLGDAPASFFYFKDEPNRITYIATAIRALPRDAMLIVNVNQGVVSFETHSLTGQELEKLEYYNADFWKTTSPEEPFNFRLVPYYTKLVFTHRYFWYGISFALLLTGVVWFIFRRRNNRKKIRSAPGN